VTVAALAFIVGVAVGMVGANVWAFAVELFDLYREERR